jgi:putative effector of murein hydrolase
MTPPSVGLSIFWMTATVGFYGVGLVLRWLTRRNPLANPPLIAIVLVAVLLRSTHTPYELYFRSTWALTFLLGPATVALGIPLATNFAHVRRSWRALAFGLFVGSVTSMLSGFLLVTLLGGTRVIALSMLPKAATTPIAMSIAGQIGGLPAVTATFAIFGGILAAIMLRPLLSVLGVSDNSTLGLAAGTAGSGIAAAHAASQGEIAGAFAAIAIGLNGLLTALAAPLLVSYFK